jgi:hypothetical protein
MGPEAKSKKSSSKKKSTRKKTTKNRAKSDEMKKQTMPKVKSIESKPETKVMNKNIYIAVSAFIVIIIIAAVFIFTANPSIVEAK